MNVLITTLPNDIHAQAIAWGLEKYGHTVVRWYPLDLAEASAWSFEPKAGRLTIDHRGTSQVISFNEIDSVWLRRVPLIIPLPHIKVINERSVAESEMSHFVAGVCNALAASCFCVNPLSDSWSAERKAGQLTVAAQIGFDVPRTIITNSIRSIADFKERIGSTIIYKPLKPFLWKHDDGYSVSAATTAIDDLSFLSSGDVIDSPAIYQELVARRAEIRITVMGRTVFAWSKQPAEGTAFATADWRYELGENVRNELYTVPPDVSEMCFAMMDRLRLKYACFDFALTPDDRHVLFEINAGGQFLWGEDLIPELPLLDAFCQFLVSRDPLFRYDPPATPVTFSSFLSETNYVEDVVSEREQHFGDLGRYHYSNSSVPYWS